MAGECWGVWAAGTVSPPPGVSGHRSSVGLGSPTPSGVWSVLGSPAPVDIPTFDQKFPELIRHVLYFIISRRMGIIEGLISLFIKVQVRLILMQNLKAHISPKKSA